MNTRAMFAIARKDLKVVSQNKNIVMPIIIILALFFVVFPLVVGLAPTLVHGLGDKLTFLDGYLAKMPAGMQQDLAGYSASQKLIVLALVYMLLPFFLIVLLMVASMIA